MEGLSPDGPRPIRRSALQPWASFGPQGRGPSLDTSPSPRLDSLTIRGHAAGP